MLSGAHNQWAPGAFQNEKLKFCGNYLALYSVFPVQTLICAMFAPLPVRIEEKNLEKVSEMCFTPFHLTFMNNDTATKTEMVLWLYFFDRMCLL